jgi:hypothetical protein
MKTLGIYITTLLMLLALNLEAQQMKQKITMDIDSLGNAKITLNMTMNASAWQTWSQTTGSNPALLKREIERSMPAYFLDDFKLDKNDMERSFELSFKGYGVCKVDKKGNWIFETDEKNADITELTERKYMLVSSPEEFGGQIQQTYIVEFPEEAKSIEIEKDAFGKTMFEFDMEKPGGGFNFLRIGGILFLVAGVVLGGISFAKK